MTENDNNPEQEATKAGNTGEEGAARFDTVKIYLKDASFEAPSTPKIFTETQFKPKMDLQIGVDYRAIDESTGVTEVVLKVTVTASFNDNTVYLVEVHQAGLFRIQHPDADTLQAMIEVGCPTILLPFAREEVNTLVTKGGFAPFLLAPVNFEVIFRQKQQKPEGESSESPVQAH